MLNVVGCYKQAAEGTAVRILMIEIAVPADSHYEDQVSEIFTHNLSVDLASPIMD